MKINLKKWNERIIKEESLKDNFIFYKLFNEDERTEYNKYTTEINIELVLTYSTKKGIFLNRRLKDHIYNERVEKELKRLPKKNYGIRISDDQVDYIMEFETISFEWDRKHKMMPSAYIENDKLYFDTREEAQAKADELNKLIDADYCGDLDERIANYNKASIKIDQLLELLDYGT